MNQLEQVHASIKALGRQLLVFGQTIVHQFSLLHNSLSQDPEWAAHMPRTAHRNLSPSNKVSLAYVSLSFQACVLLTGALAKHLLWLVVFVFVRASLHCSA